MQKPKISTIELVFILIAASSLFVLTVHQMSTAGILPGNDPSVHLAKAKQIIIDERVSYSEVAWYPPFFHTIVATIQIFAGTTDAMAAAFITKMLIATLNVMIMLATYLLTRKFFGIGTAVAAVAFTVISVPLFEMIFWGGYANFMGLAYIAFIFYIMNMDLGVKVKTFLLFSGTFTLILIHQLTAFVFVLMFVPVFLISSIGSKRKFLTFLAVIVGGTLALLAWYARIIIDYADIIIEYIFYTMGENVYNIGAVSYESLNKNLGVTLFITAVGIPLIFVAKKKQTSIRDVLLIIFWFAVPFLLAESHLFGVNLPYHRFIYFFATPITILCGVATYFAVSKAPELIQSKLVSKLTKSLKTLNVIKILAGIIIVSIVVIHASTFLQLMETYPQFYERGSIPSYNSGLWVKEHSDPEGIVITTRSPGSWFYIFSDIRTIQETDPTSSRSAIAESILYSFYEIENSRTLTREFDPVSPSAGQAIYVSRFNLWTRVVSIPNEQVKFVYVSASGEWMEISLSETVETTYWTQNSTDKTQLITEYSHELFTVEKTVTFSSSSSVIDINWNTKAHQDLTSVKLIVCNLLDLSLDFKEALVPGILEWQNPWDNPTYVDAQQRWVMVEGENILTEKHAAILDPTNGVMAAFQVDETPFWSSIGALDNRVIDAVRFRYELGDLSGQESSEVSYSVLVYSFELEEPQRWTLSELEQQFNAQSNLMVHGRDFRTYIEEYNIQFVAIDTEQVVSNIKATPALDKIYDNGRATVHTTKK